MLRCDTSGRRGCIVGIKTIGGGEGSIVKTKERDGVEGVGGIVDETLQRRIEGERVGMH